VLKIYGEESPFSSVAVGASGVSSSPATSRPSARDSVRRCHAPRTRDAVVRGPSPVPLASANTAGAMACRLRIFEVDARAP
jgi:hypothetical protein